jgi:hypothetical protein
VIWSSFRENLGKAASDANATSGFKVTEIYPLVENCTSDFIFTVSHASKFNFKNR